MGHQQVADESLQAAAILQRPGQAGGEGGLAEGLAFGALLDLGRDTPLDHLEYDVVLDADFPLQRSDIRQIEATLVAVLDGQRFLDRDVLQIGAGEIVGLGWLAARPGAPGGVRLVHLRGRDAGVAAGLAGGLFQQHRHQQCQQAQQGPQHGVDFGRDLAALAQHRDLPLDALQLRAQGLLADARHHSASTASSAASTASRSPGGMSA